MKNYIKSENEDTNQEMPFSSSVPYCMTRSICMLSRAAECQSQGQSYK